MKKNKSIKKYEIINIMEGFLYNACIAVSPIFLYLFLKDIKNESLRIIYAAAYIISLLFQVILGYLDMRILWKYEKTFKGYYNNQINYKYIKIDFRKIRLPDGYVISLIHNVNDYHAYSENKLMLVRYSIAFVIYAVVLIVFLKFYAAVVLLILVIVYFISKIPDKRLMIFREKYIEEKGKLMAKIRNKLQSYDFFTHKVFWHISRSFQEDFNKEAKAKRNNDVMLNITKATNGFMTDLYKILNLLLCFIAISQNYFSLFYCLIGYQLSKYLSELFDVISKERNTLKNYSGSLAELKKYFGCEEVPELIADNISKVKFNKVKIIKNSFTLSADLTVSLDKKYFLCGENGSGKTTFCNALASLDMIDEGQILLDSQNYLNYNCNNLCFVCSAEPLIYEGSLLENVSMFKTMPFDDRKLEGLIRQRYDNLCRYDNSLLMSGGERQFICFLRSIHTKAPILIYDEAFSQIDEELRTAIYEYIHKLNRCVIIIDHKIQGLKGYERLYIREGELRYE